MGPFYWVLDALGVPDWVAQRLWLGTILLVRRARRALPAAHARPCAGPGVAGRRARRSCSRPYLLDYSARISVILLPWAGLPWLLAFVDPRRCGDGGWRYPALFALVVQVVGSVNATALVFAGHRARCSGSRTRSGSTHEVDVPARRSRPSRDRRAHARHVAVVDRPGSGRRAATASTSCGTPRRSQTVSRTSLPTEVLRGLGYWFFYGRDKLGPWIEASVDYTQRPWLHRRQLRRSPVLALLVGRRSCAGGTARYFVLLTLVGVVDRGRRASRTTARRRSARVVQGVRRRRRRPAFALRSTGRATPLVVLGLAVLLGGRRQRARASARRRTVTAAAALVDRRARRRARRSSTCPRSGTARSTARTSQRARGDPAVLEGRDRRTSTRRPHDTRVLELPGTDFASYRWGNTVDPITPGLMDRPVRRPRADPVRLAGVGQPAERVRPRIQDASCRPGRDRAIARLMSAGDIVLRNDLQYERYRLIRPAFLWRLFNPPPRRARRAEDVRRARRRRQRTQYPFLDEQALGGPPNLEVPPPVAVFPVERPEADRPARSRRAGSVVIAGDGDGIVDAAEAGLLDADPLVFYSAGVRRRTPAALRAQVDRGATLVVTDTNRERARRWSTVTDTVGLHRGAGQPSARPRISSDARLDLFPDAPPDAYTTTELRGVEAVWPRATTATRSRYTPEDRAAARVRRRSRAPRGGPARSTTSAASGSGSCSTTRSRPTTSTSCSR